MQFLLNLDSNQDWVKVRNLKDQKRRRSVGPKFLLRVSAARELSSLKSDNFMVLS